MEGADEVLAARKVDRGLASDRRIDLADERRRHRHPRHPAHVGRRGEPGEVGRAAAAEADDRAVPADPQCAPEPLEHRDRLRGLAGRDLVARGVSIAERELRRDAVDPGHVRVGDDLDGAGAGHELLEQLEGADPDIDPGSGEHDPVGVVGMGVGDLFVDRQPREVERVERLLVDRERPPALARALPRGVRVDLEQHRERAPERAQAASSAETTAPPPRAITAGSGASSAADGDRLLGDPEPGFPVPREQLLDRRARPALDLLVEVDEGPAEPARDLAPLRRLSRAHEAGEREMAVQSVRGHRMRST